MYCTNCGAERSEEAAVCARCGRNITHFPPPEAVPNHIVQAILVSLCCCLPLGIVALIYSSRVNTKLALGDLAGAQVASRHARGWILASFFTWILFAGAMTAYTYFKS